MRDASALKISESAEWRVPGAGTAAASWSGSGRRRSWWRPIFYGVSALSLAINAAALAESLQLRAALASWLHGLLPQLRDGAGLLLQRPVLFILLNLITLSVLFKSGLLATGPGSKRQRHSDRNRLMQEIVSEAHHRSSLLQPVDPTEDDNGDDTSDRGLQIKTSMPRWSAKKPSIDALVARGEPSLKNSPKLPARVGSQLQAPVRRASLFTIEPLREPTVDAQFPSVTMGKNPSPSPSPKTVHAGRTPTHRYDGSSDDYDLSTQELNARVDGFIAKVKKNLSMQREDSFNRLLALVGKQR